LSVTRWLGNWCKPFSPRDSAARSVIVAVWPKWRRSKCTTKAKRYENKSPGRKAGATWNTGQCAERLITAYYTGVPDPAVPAQRVAFGTSGHRGSSFKLAFNEWHILAITQAICLYRKRQGTDGPLFLGIDTHALSVPACASALEVLAANGVEVMLAEGDEYTPTPVISHAILTYNRGRKTGLADGIVITPSHNPPHDGGFKYNPPNGGPADNVVTDWIEAKANALLEARLKGVKRIPHEQALRASTTHRHDYLSPYIADLGNSLTWRSSAIRSSGWGLIRWAAPASIIGRESPSDMV
jgi:alpha-D-glucose phosphate-specific phosphoglucomutase